MRLQKTTARKKRNIIKKIIFFGGVGTILIFGIIFLFVYKYLLNPRIQFLSPLSSEVSAVWNQTNDNKSELISIFKKEHINFSKISTVQNSTLLVILPNEEEVLMSSDKDLHLQVTSLQVIVSRLTMEGKRFKKRDLRFGRPVITLLENYD